MYIQEIKLREFKPTADIIKRYYNGREVILYGLLGDPAPLKALLERDYGIKINITVTGNKNHAQNGILHLDEFRGKSSEYYIVAPFLKQDAKIKNWLSSLEYSEFKDYVFSLHDEIILNPGSEDYHDEYGNHIHCKNCKVVLKPFAGNTNINVADSTSFDKDCVITIWDSNTEVFMGEGCQFAFGTKIRLRNDSKFIVGSHTTFGYGGNIAVTPGNEIKIGEDCMFSWNIELCSGDGHTIFDVEKRKRVTEPMPGTARNTIEIQDHVWVGMKSIILNNTFIGRSSIIGAGAVVKGKFPNNCAVAGNPAKVVRKNVTWSRGSLDTDIEKCGEDNIYLTEEV